LTHIQKREILHLRGQGLDYARIADAVGLPKNTVKTFCWRNQQKPGPPTAVVEPVAAPTPTKITPEGHCPNCGIFIAQTPRRRRYAKLRPEASGAESNA